MQNHWLQLFFQQVLSANSVTAYQWQCVMIGQSVVDYLSVACGHTEFKPEVILRSIS